MLTTIEVDSLTLPEASDKSPSSIFCPDIWSLTLVPDTALLKALEFPRLEECLLFNEVTVGDFLDNFRMELVTRKTKPQLGAQKGREAGD